VREKIAIEIFARSIFKCLRGEIRKFEELSKKFQEISGIVQQWEKSVHLPLSKRIFQEISYFFFHLENFDETSFIALNNAQQNNFLQKLPENFLSLLSQKIPTVQLRVQELLFLVNFQVKPRGKLPGLKTLLGCSQAFPHIKFGSPSDLLLDLWSE
jgi:hypothetical protein